MKRSYIYVAALCAAAALVAVGAWQFFKVSPPPAGSVERLAVERASRETATFSMDEVAAHGTAEDCWTAISGGVYDVTSFIPQHPGGRAIIPACGADGTSLFSLEPEHVEEQAMQVLESTYRIGTLR